MTSVTSLIRRGVLVLIFLGSMPGATPALAAITSITVAPGAVNAPLGGSTSVAVTWSVTTNSGTFVSSPNGTFSTAGGVVVGTVSNALFQSVTVIPGFGSTVPFTEVVLVPTDVIYRVYKLGLGGFLYSRSFTDSTGAPSTQSVTINITSSAVTGFSLTGMSLSFDDGKVVRLLDRKEKLYAQADVNFTGNGLLQGVWEVADPASTAGEPIFRPLTSVRQYLVGNGKQTLRSPILPTDISGLYIVRLRINDPVPGFDQPVLRYFVSSGKPGEVLPIMPIGLIMPPHQTLLAPDTVFAWEAIRGAHAYQVEVYARAVTAADKLPSLGGDAGMTPPTLPGTPPVAGMLVAGTQTQTVLSVAARSHLQPGGIYLWRVLAIGGDGSVVGESLVREIRLP